MSTEEWVRISRTCRAWADLQPMTLKVESMHSGQSISRWLSRHLSMTRAMQADALKSFVSLAALPESIPALKVMVYRGGWVHTSLDSDWISHLLKRAINLHALLLDGWPLVGLSLPQMAHLKHLILIRVVPSPLKQFMSQLCIQGGPHVLAESCRTTGHQMTACKLNFIVGVNIDGILEHNFLSRSFPTRCNARALHLTMHNSSWCFTTEWKGSMSALVSGQFSHLAVLRLSFNGIRWSCHPQYV